ARGEQPRAAARAKGAPGRSSRLLQRKEKARRVGLELERGEQRIGRGCAEQGLLRPRYALGAPGRERDPLRRQRRLHGFGVPRFRNRFRRHRLVTSNLMMIMEVTMPHANARDGTRLYFEETGTGTPLIFIHEFAGDHRSWEPQVRFFSRYFPCVTYAARGFPPSDIPDDAERYSQAIARGDALAILDHLKIDRAHIVGLSMGGFAALHFGITYPQRARSLVIAGCGYGAEPDKKEKFRA